MPAGALNAMPRRPSSAACLAAASVPECQIELPRLKPRLQPDSTRSTLPHWYAPSATQSAGVPLTRYASGPTIRVARYESGRLAVIGVTHRRLLDVGRDYPDRAELGRHLGQRRNTRAVDAIVVADQDSHAVDRVQSRGHVLALTDARCGSASTGTTRRAAASRSIASRHVIQRAGQTVVRAIDDASDSPRTSATRSASLSAGGDGTVARAGRVLPAARSRWRFCRSVRPTILRAVSISTATSSSWPHAGTTARCAKIDVGVVEVHGRAHRFLESVGCGLVTSCIDEGNETLAKDHPETHLAEAHEMYVETLRGMRAASLRHHARRRTDLVGSSCSSRF